MNKPNLRDIAITKILNDEKNKEYLIRLIHEITKLDINILRKSLRYLPRDINDNVDLKGNEVDSLVYANDTYINIEVNTSNNAVMRNKSMSYVCHLLLRQTKIGEKYQDICPIYQINIDSFDFLGKNKFIYSGRIREDNSNDVMDNTIVLYHVNLKYLKKMDYTKIIKKPIGSLEKLLYLLVCSDEEKLKLAYNGDEVMSKVMKEFDFINDDFDKMLIYNREDYIKAQGFAEGEEKIKIKVIKNMLNKNMTHKDIMDILNIHKDEFKKILTDIKR